MSTPPKTKTVSYYIDLEPGWQDMPSPDLLRLWPADYFPYPGRRRIRIEVELPCFGGSADPVVTIPAKVIQ